MTSRGRRATPENLTLRSTGEDIGLLAATMMDDLKGKGDSRAWGIWGTIHLHVLGHEGR